ncbi:hypothetical protein FQR65_LT03663 [Abscondita terminalis]|nr:hypothetical protein FQR65_LT03663 [Abscondita terminalis]
MGQVPSEYEIVDENEEVEDMPDDGQEDENSSENIPEASQNSDHATCIICKQSVPTVLLPCKHFGFCDDCIEEYKMRKVERQRPDEELGYVIDYTL